MTAPQLPPAPATVRTGVPDFLIQAGVALIALAAVAIVIPQIMQPGVGGIAVVFWTIALFFAGLAVIGVAALLGLPIRLIPGARAWWIAHPALAVVGLIASAVVLLAALALYRAWFEHLVTLTPELVAALYLPMGLGWLGVEFFVLHWWAPVRALKNRQSS